MMPCVLLMCFLAVSVTAFAPPPHHVQSRFQTQQDIQQTTGVAPLHAAWPPSYNDGLFPVLKQIQGIDWEGECRYTGADLVPASFLLKGGSRYDIDGKNLNLTSFLTFPNGKTRRVSMSGTRGSLERASMRLDPVEEEGPVYMVLTELAPDTLLLNEVERASGKIILTSSLSIVNGGSEIVQVSHEVGSGDMPIEGHQVWRLKKAVIRIEDGVKKDDELFRDTTGR